MANLQSQSRRKRYAAFFAALGFLAGTVVGVAGDRYGPGLLVRGERTFGRDLIEIKQHWPQRPCTPVAVAGTEVDPRLDQNTEQIGSDHLLASGSSVAYRAGRLQLDLSAVSGDDIFVYDVKVHVFEHEAAHPAWALADEAGGCGPDRIPLNLKLANGAGKVSNPAIPNEGVEFTLSASVPVVLEIEASACDEYYEFGVELQYSVRGADFSENIGSRSDPLKIMGGTAEVLYSSSLTPGPDQVHPNRGGYFPDCT
jgi:hypothetical protein